MLRPAEEYERSAFASARAQGLPDMIEDPTVLARVAALLPTPATGCRPPVASAGQGSRQRRLVPSSPAPR